MMIYAITMKYLLSYEIPSWWYQNTYEMLGQNTLPMNSRVFMGWYTMKKLWNRATVENL